jgi:Asp-tRNA(Asn)/Glu-tRNA(Gln) amidotransferase B subunit
MNESEEISQLEDLKFEISQFARVIQLINIKELSSTNAKIVIEELFHTG